MKKLMNAVLNNLPSRFQLICYVLAAGIAMAIGINYYMEYTAPWYDKIF